MTESNGKYKQDPPESSVWTDEQNAIISEGFDERIDAYRKQSLSEWEAKPESREQQRAVKEFTDPGFWEKFGEGEEGRERSADLWFGTGAFPFGSTVKDVTHVKGLVEAFEASEKGEATRGQLHALEDYQDWRFRQQFGSKAAKAAGQIIGMGPAFMPELATGSILMKKLLEMGVKHAAIKGFAKYLQKGAMTRAAVSKLGPAAEQGAAKALAARTITGLERWGGWTVPAGAKQYAVQNLIGEAAAVIPFTGGGGRTRMGMYRNWLQVNTELGFDEANNLVAGIVDNPEGWFPLGFGSAVDDGIEMWSEVTGGVLAKVLPAMKMARLKQLVTRTGKKAVTDKLRVASWDGLLPEMGEELVGAVARETYGAFGPEAGGSALFGGEVEEFFDPEQFLGMFIGLGVSGGGARLATKAFSGGKNVTEKALKEFQEVILAQGGGGQADYAAPELAIKLIRDNAKRAALADYDAGAAAGQAPAPISGEVKDEKPADRRQRYANEKANDEAAEAQKLTPDKLRDKVEAFELEGEYDAPAFSNERAAALDAMDDSITRIRKDGLSQPMRTPEQRSEGYQEQVNGWLGKLVGETVRVIGRSPFRKGQVSGPGGYDTLTDFQKRLLELAATWRMNLIFVEGKEQSFPAGFYTEKDENGNPTGRRGVAINAGKAASELTQWEQDLNATAAEFDTLDEAEKDSLVESRMFEILFHEAMHHAAAIHGDGFVADVARMVKTLNPELYTKARRAYLAGHPAPETLTEEEIQEETIAVVSQVMRPFMRLMVESGDTGAFDLMLEKKPGSWGKLFDSVARAASLVPGVNIDTIALRRVRNELSKYAGEHADEMGSQEMLDFARISRELLRAFEMPAAPEVAEPVDPTRKKGERSKGRKKGKKVEEGGKGVVELGEDIGDVQGGVQDQGYVGGTSGTEEEDEKPAPSTLESRQARLLELQIKIAERELQSGRGASGRERPVIPAAAPRAPAPGVAAEPTVAAPTAAQPRKFNTADIDYEPTATKKDVKIKTPNFWLGIEDIGEDQAKAGLEAALAAAGKTLDSAIGGPLDDMTYRQALDAEGNADVDGYMEQRWRATLKKELQAQLIAEGATDLAAPKKTNTRDSILSNIYDVKRSTARVQPGLTRGIERVEQTGALTAEEKAAKALATMASERHKPDPTAGEVELAQVDPPPRPLTDYGPSLVKYAYKHFSTEKAAEEWLEKQDKIALRELQKRARDLWGQMVQWRTFGDLSAKQRATLRGRIAEMLRLTDITPAEGEFEKKVHQFVTEYNAKQSKKAKHSRRPIKRGKPEEMLRTLLRIYGLTIERPFTVSAESFTEEYNPDDTMDTMRYRRGRGWTASDPYLPSAEDLLAMDEVQLAARAYAVWGIDEPEISESISGMRGARYVPRQQRILKAILNKQAIDAEIKRILAESTPESAAGVDVDGVRMEATKAVMGEAWLAKQSDVRPTVMVSESIHDMVDPAMQAGDGSLFAYFPHSDGWYHTYPEDVATDTDSKSGVALEAADALYASHEKKVRALAAAQEEDPTNMAIDDMLSEMQEQGVIMMEAIQGASARASETYAKDPGSPDAVLLAPITGDVRIMHTNEEFTEEDLYFISAEGHSALVVMDPTASEYANDDAPSRVYVFNDSIVLDVGDQQADTKRGDAPSFRGAVSAGTRPVGVTYSRTLDALGEYIEGNDDRTIRGQDADEIYKRLRALLAKTGNAPTEGEMAQLEVAGVIAGISRKSARIKKGALELDLDELYEALKDHERQTNTERNVYSVGEWVRQVAQGISIKVVGGRVEGSSDSTAPAPPWKYSEYGPAFIAEYADEVVEIGVLGGQPGEFGSEADAPLDEYFGIMDREAHYPPQDFQLDPDAMSALGHIRAMVVRLEDGSRVLLLYEVQSDLAKRAADKKLMTQQQARAADIGLRHGLVKPSGKPDVDGYRRLLLRMALKHAAEMGIDKIALPGSQAVVNDIALGTQAVVDTDAARTGNRSAAHDWFTKLYMQTLPKLLNEVRGEYYAPPGIEYGSETDPGQMGAPVDAVAKKAGRDPEEVGDAYEHLRMLAGWVPSNRLAFLGEPLAMRVFDVPPKVMEGRATHARQAVSATMSDVNTARALEGKVPLHINDDEFGVQTPPRGYDISDQDAVVGARVARLQEMEQNPYVRKQIAELQEDLTRRKEGLAPKHAVTPTGLTPGTGPASAAFPGNSTDKWRVYMDKYLEATDVAINFANTRAKIHDDALWATLPSDMSPKDQTQAMRDRELGMLNYIDLKNAATQTDHDVRPDGGIPTEQEIIDYYSGKVNTEQRRMLEYSQNLPEDVRRIADSIIAENDAMGEVALANGVIFGKHEVYSARMWFREGEGQYGGLIEPVKAGGSFAQKGRGRQLKRVYRSIAQGWANGEKLTVPSATEAQRIAQRQVSEAVYNIALLRALKDNDIALKLEEGKSAPSGYRGLTNIQMAGWVVPDSLASHLNTLTSKLDYASWGKWARAIVQTNSVVKQSILTFSFFHHQAFLRSFLYTVPGADVLPEMAGVTGLMSGAVKSAGMAAGRVQRASVEESASRMRGYQAGRKAIMEQSPALIELVRAGLTIMSKQELDVLAEQSSADWTRKAEGHFAGMRERFIEFRRTQARATNWLFNNMGAHLKTQAALLEYQHLLSKHAAKMASGEMTREDIARWTAEKVNADFGGLNLRRSTGKATKGPRSAQAQLAMRLLFLAPDWTESNFVTAKNSFKRGEEGAVYRQMWLSVSMRALLPTLAWNFLMAGMDWDEFEDNTIRAAHAGKESVWDGIAKGYWMDMNMTPFANQMNKHLGEKGATPGADKYFSAIGHFRDPLKWLMQLTPGLGGGGVLQPLKSKASPAARTLLNAVTGADWAGRGYTDIDKALGLSGWRDGDPEGTQFGTTNAFVPYGERGKMGMQQMPSFLMERVVSAAPIQLEALWGFTQGQNDLFDTVARLFGMATHTTRPKDTGE